MNQAPPKLQQLLHQMPDVDKVKLLQIAQHYAMDLDDPGFLPLLLTHQGIEALEYAKNELIREAGGTVSVALNQAQKALETAEKTAKSLDSETEKFALTLSRATQKIGEASKNNCLKSTLIASLCSLIIGMGIGYFSAAKTAYSERNYSEQVTQNIVKACTKK